VIPGGAPNALVNPRQLVEVAVRALSPGVNDPHTAISVRLGSALCSTLPRRLPTGVLLRDGRAVLVVPSVDCDGPVAAMFHMIRQNAAGKPAVLIRLLEVLTSVASCERDPAWLETLQLHADLVPADAERSISTLSDLDDVCARHGDFAAMRRGGPLALLGADQDALQSFVQRARTFLATNHVRGQNSPTKGERLARSPASRAIMLPSRGPMPSRIPIRPGVWNAKTGGCDGFRNERPFERVRVPRHRERQSDHHSRYHPGLRPHV
jgi:hypothetical protein